MSATLDYRQAARRVRRSVRTIKRWRKAGLQMSLAPDGRRVVDESRLLEWWRARMTADPVHQIRLRNLQRTSLGTDNDELAIDRKDARSG